jgi:beta-galactosidase
MKKLLFILILIPILLPAQKNDEFLHALYDKLHDSPMQQKIREIAPMPFGVVFLPWAGCNEQDMRQHFRMMKKLGFHNLKQTMATPEWSEKEILRIALEEDVIPFWYGEGGWEKITSELLAKLNIPKNTPLAEIRKHPKMLEYQKNVMLKHLANWKQPAYDTNLIPYQHEPDAYLRADDEMLFKHWVKEKYKTIEELVKAWNHYEVGIRKNPYKTWDDFYNDQVVFNIPKADEIIPSSGREYGFVKDVLRFKADMYLKNVKNFVVSNYPEQPVRAGGEMGLFLPFASRAIDMEGIADVMKDRGSFYPSIHLAWHFEEVDYEVTRCVYMQSSLATDWFKGGWAAVWESTGGPQQFSGGKGWDRKGAESTAGFTVDGGTITQMLLSYLAGGLKGVGLWAWNYRRAGWESGEYALLNRQNEPGERAIRAGQIAQAAEKYRDELWAAHKEPYVGVFVNWDNEAIWAACAVPNRTHFKNYPVQARIGISRALINANIPWEHVTPSDLKAGLAMRYKVIYLPAQVAINEDLFPIFEQYVRDGGRLVLDAPGAWWNEQGKVLDTGKGSAFERIFGASIADYQYANNVKPQLANLNLTGFLLDIKPTSADVLQKFNNNAAAVTEHRLDKGSAIILSPDASFSMKNKGNEPMENWVINVIMQDIRKPYECKNAIVYRLASEMADHYFILNDGSAKNVSLKLNRYKYRHAIDAVTQQKVSISSINIEANGGRWIRCEK